MRPEELLLYGSALKSLTISATKKKKWMTGILPILNKSK